MMSFVVNLVDDIKPISDFRANSAALLKQVQDSGRPLILTQHGRSAAVLVDVRAYQDMVEELHTLRELTAARAEHAQGESTTHGDLTAELRDHRG